MVHVVDFVEGNDRCHVTNPPRVSGTRPTATLPAAVVAKGSQSGSGPSVNVVSGPERTGTAVLHPVAGVPYHHPLRVDVFAAAVWARDPSAAVPHHHDRRPRAR